MSQDAGPPAAADAAGSSGSEITHESWRAPAHPGMNWPGPPQSLIGRHPPLRERDLEQGGSEDEVILDGADS